MDYYLCVRATLTLLNLITFQPIPLVNYNNIEMVKPGRFPAGKTELPFEFLLKPKPNKSLYESYHGVFVNIQVSIVENKVCIELSWPSLSYSRHSCYICYATYEYF